MTSTFEFPASLLLVGAGKMGGSLLRGWLAAGFPGGSIAVVDPHLAEPALSEWRAQGVLINPASLPFDPTVLILAIKPQMLEASAEGINALIGPQTVIVSILAGKTIGNLAHYLPRAGAIVRTMPNLPASIGQGATGAYANDAVTSTQREKVDALLRTSGIVAWLESEEQIDAVTAISGSGPAYVFHMTECLSAAGVALGLPEALAARLAHATVTGSAALMAAEPGTPPARLRENVTSPNGTTEAALKILMADDNMPALLRAATKAARLRAEDLSG